MATGDSSISTALELEHYQHLLGEGFTADEITELEAYGCESVTRTQALKLGIKKWNGSRHISDGGLYFPFHQEYGQIRLNTPIETDGKKFKYLGPSKPVKAWFPQTKVHAITEGWKDAAMPTVRGIPTAAIVGVDNIIYSIPESCETPIIFDSDGWKNPQVVRGLVIGALWTNGRINLFPEMPDYPTGGACEFFKSGNSIADYQALIDSAMKPGEFIKAWVQRWSDFDEILKAECARVAAELSHFVQSPGTYRKRLENKVSDKLQTWSGKGLDVPPKNGISKAAAAGLRVAIQKASGLNQRIFDREIGRDAEMKMLSISREVDRKEVAESEDAKRFVLPPRLNPEEHIFNLAFNVPGKPVKVIDHAFREYNSEYGYWQSI
ncbi:MAG: hypothetical protein AAF609_18475, partial [Cyanobacteria bacterium P01_C01_bin.120]